MVLRVFGIKEEATYGEDIPFSGIEPDWHKRISKGSFVLNDEPVLFGEGSRMNQTARPGATKPTGSVESEVDLKRIGHSLKAFLDQYKFTEGEEDDPNIHEFYGRESNSLTSFKGVATFDEFEKRLNGLLLDGLKLEVSDEAMTLSEDWVYKTQQIKNINQSTYQLREVEGAVPVMFYDVALTIDDTVPPGIVSSFSLEGKNNLNVDSTLGLGSRFPQAKPQAQKREITPNFVSTLRSETLDFIKKAEHGSNTDTPSNCLVAKLKLDIKIQICDDASEYLEITFPDCLVNVEYESSGSDEIETTFNLQSLGASKVMLADGITEVTTDMYCKLVTDVDKIQA